MSKNSSKGELFIKLPNISFPFTNGELILAMANQVHTDAQVRKTGLFPIVR